MKFLTLLVLFSHFSRQVRHKLQQSSFYFLFYAVASAVILASFVINCFYLEYIQYKCFFALIEISCFVTIKYTCFLEFSDKIKKKKKEKRKNLDIL